MNLAILCLSLFVFAYSANGLCFSCKSKHTTFEQLTISPSFVSIFGNIPITIQGADLHDAVSVQIRFNDETAKIVDASITGNVVTCIVPYLYKNGRIQVDMLVKRTDNTIVTFYGYIYTEKHRTSLHFEFVDMTSIKISWDRSQFEVGASLDLELLEVVGGVFISRGVIISNILNNGLFLGELNRLAINIIKSLRNIFVVQLQINSQSSQNPAVKQHKIISDYLNQLRGKSERELNELCYSWYIQDKGAPKDALPCPPTLQKALVDDRFEPVDDLKLYNPGADHGFMQRVPSRSGAAQRCVYKNGKLLVGPPSGGNVRSVSPNGPKGEVPHIIADILPWYTCCNLTVSKSFCNLYYERRPSNNGSDWLCPRHGNVVGDPHFTTFDGLYYTFLGLGEFWIIKSEDFAMQGRFTQFLDTGATVCTVYVMHHRSYDGEATVQLSLKEKYIEIKLDGQVVPIDPNVKQPKRTIMHNGASILINSLQDIRVTFSSGYSFKFTYDPYVINMAATVIEELKGTFNGLFGTFDDNQENELTYPSGKVIPTDSDPKKIHDFGMHWKIACEESLFTYALDKDCNSYHDDNFVPLLEAPDLDKLSPEDVAACKGSHECLFDLAVTGNKEMATGTANAIEDFLSISKSLRVGCGRISVPRNGRLVVLNYLEGSIVRLVCNENFKVQGIDSVKCVKNLLGRLTWNGTLGECVSANKCANPNAWLQFLCENELNAQ